MSGISKHESKLFTQHAIIAAQHEGLNQKKLAEKLGLEETRLSEAKNGKSSILPSTRDQIIELYGMPRRGQGQFVDAETYKSVEHFIQSYQKVTQQRHLDRLVTTFSRTDYQEIIRRLFGIKEGWDQPADVQTKMKVDMINGILNDKRFIQWGKEVDLYLSEETDRFDRKPLPSFDESLLVSLLKGFQNRDSDIFSIAHREGAKSKDFISGFYWLWFTKFNIPAFEFGNKQSVSAPQTKELILTGDLILDSSYQTGKVRNINHLTMESWYNSKSHFTGLGHVPSRCDILPLLEIPDSSLINSKPDHWPTTSIKLYLSESLEYHLWITLDGGHEVRTYQDLIDPREIVIPHIHWSELYDEIEKIRKWVGAPSSPIKKIKENIANAGGYVPGAEVL